MITIDLYSGLLGVGKTTLIRRMLETTYKDQQVVILENELGKVNYDSAVLGASGMRVEQITAGCVCCTVAGDFKAAIRRIGEELHPDVVILEPSGASDVRTLLRVILEVEGVSIGRSIMLVNAKKCLALLRVIGDFYKDQIRCADTIFLNFAEQVKEGQLPLVIEELQKINPKASFVAIPLREVGADTFPLTPQPVPMPDDSEEVQDDRSLRVIDDDTVSMKMGRSRRSTRKLPAPGRTAPEGPQLHSWTYAFPRAFTPSQLEALDRIFEAPEAETIWRVKGILTLSDGSYRKYDVTFGDIFGDSFEGDADVPRNTLVIIGPEIPRGFLIEQFHQLFPAE